MATEILWTDETWNPIVGCSHASPGCDNCYAEKAAVSPRLQQFKQYQEVTDVYHVTETENERLWNGKTVFVESALEKPLHWKAPRKIFVCSMSDLFHESVPFEWIDKIFAVMALCPQHTFQVLTKRPERMAEYLYDYLQRVDYMQRAAKEMKLPHNDFVYMPEKTGVYNFTIPLPNVWLGVTAENQEMADKRIPILLQIPAALRFVSVEPMLGPVDLNETSAGNIIGPCDECGEYHGSCDCCMGIPSLDWVIIGAESGSKRRMCELEWAQNLTTQCKMASVPVFVKQLHGFGTNKLIKAPAGWPREMPEVN